MCTGVAAAQQMMISPEDLQQLLQASMQPSLDWNANAELLHQLQQVMTGLHLSVPCPVRMPDMHEGIHFARHVKIVQAAIEYSAPDMMIACQDCIKEDACCETCAKNCGNSHCGTAMLRGGWCIAGWCRAGPCMAPGIWAAQQAPGSQRARVCACGRITAGACCPDRRALAGRGNERR